MTKPAKLDSAHAVRVLELVEKASPGFFQRFLEVVRVAGEVLDRLPAEVRARLLAAARVTDEAQVDLGDAPSAAEIARVRNLLHLCVDCGGRGDEPVHTGWAESAEQGRLMALFTWLCDGCAEKRRKAGVQPLPWRRRFPRSDRPVDEL